MAITIISRQGPSRERIRESIAQKYAEQRKEVRGRVGRHDGRTDKDYKEESRVKLEKRGFFRRD